MLEGPTGSADALAELSGGTGAVSLAAMSHSDWQLWKELGAWTREAAPRQGWREDELAFAIPEGTRALRITLRIKGKGAVWFDQVRLDERRNDGSYAEVQRSGNAVFRIMSQWAKLAAAGSCTSRRGAPCRIRCPPSSPQARSPGWQTTRC